MMSPRESFDVSDVAKGWSLRRQTLEYTGRPLLMGIINVTPDSFSDGGKFWDAEAAIEHGLELARQGADLLDIGGESTRPYSEPVKPDEELRRVLPVVQELASQTDVPLSIDTSKAAVADAALAAGAQVINDVTGLEGDPEMLSLAAESNAGVCAMHMQGTPQTMQDAPQYEDVVQEIYDYLQQRRDQLTDNGISLSRICLDVGIGFGKTHQHNLALLAHASSFHRLGCPLMVGHSRKGFIAHVLGDKEADRTAGSVGVALAMGTQHVQVLRIHDVAAVRQAWLLFEATRNSQS
jgi:dihydropteroate synthase